MTVNVRLSPEQILYTINHAEDDVMLVNTEFLPMLESHPRPASKRSSAGVASTTPADAGHDGSHRRVRSPAGAGSRLRVPRF
jgi:hypothetical protein